MFGSREVFKIVWTGGQWAVHSPHTNLFFPQTSITWAHILVHEHALLALLKALTLLKPAVDSSWRPVRSQQRSKAGAKMYSDASARDIYDRMQTKTESPWSSLHLCTISHARDMDSRVVLSEDFRSRVTCSWEVRSEPQRSSWRSKITIQVQTCDFWI